MRNTTSSRAFSPVPPARRRVRAPARSAIQRPPRRQPQRTALHRTMRLLERRLGTLVPALALLSLTLLLAVGCSLTPASGGTTGSGSARPNITPPPVPSPITQLPSGPAQPAVGAPAVTPHLDGVPAFTTDDMAAYVKNHGLPTNFGAGGAPTIVQNAFVSSDAVGQMLNLPGGVVGLSASQSHRLSAAASQAQSAPAKPADAKLIGLVVQQGHFMWPPATPSSPPPTSPYAYEIFDAKTGNLLIYGGLAQPPAGGPTATPTPTSPPTGAPTATPTPRSQPTPTNTAGPQCNVLLTSGATMNVDHLYLAVDSAGSPTNPGISLAAADDVKWNTTPAPGTMAPINSAKLADMGPIGATGFNNLTCAQIKLANYIAPSVPTVNDEVFLVKTNAGNYAKVLISVGNPDLTLRWQTNS